MLPVPDFLLGEHGVERRDGEVVEGADESESDLDVQIEHLDPGEKYQG